jgi:hypothetical protein
MNFSLPPGTIALLPVAQLDKIKRYQECIGNFACEIRGRDVDRCIKAISPMVHELENMKDGSYRIHKPTEPQARLIQQQVTNWVASSPESREVDAYPVSTDHSCQQAKDASNPQLSGTCAASFNGGVAIPGGPWSVSLDTNADGSISAVHLFGPGHKESEAPPVAAIKELAAAPKAEAKETAPQKVQAETVEATAQAETKTEKVKPKVEAKKVGRAKATGTPRKRPSKTSK